MNPLLTLMICFFQFFTIKGFKKLFNTTGLILDFNIYLFMVFLAIGEGALIAHRMGLLLINQGFLMKVLGISFKTFEIRLNKMEDCRL